MNYLLCLCVAVFAGAAWAETVDIKDIQSRDGEDASTTTIEIKKGKPGQVKTENQWELTDGTADVQGDSGATNKDAQGNWKKSCNDWKKEIRDENKENKVISLNCGTMACSGEAGNKSCTSKATYKIKTRVN
jgi:hypothetical protein